MFGSQAIELFVAIVTMLFIVSLASSTIVEGIGNMGRRRGKQLEKAIANVLKVGDAPPDAPTQSSLVTKALSAGTKVGETEVVKAIQTKPKRFPSAISRETFLEIAEELRDAVLDEEEKRKLLRKFDEAMDRLSSAFQRRTKLWLFLCGLVIAVCGNVSVYHIAQTLWSDDAAREAVVEAASNIGSGDQDIQAEELSNIGATVEELQDASLPVGWTDDAKDAWGGRGWDEFDAGRVGLFFGWVATAALVTLGAPFWFDLLTKAVPKALGSKPKDETKTETPK